MECGHEVIRVQFSEMALPWRRARLGDGCCEADGVVEGVRLLDLAEMLDRSWRVASWQLQGENLLAWLGETLAFFFLQNRDRLC